MKKRKEEIVQAVARGWCSEKNSSKTMDSDLAMAIVNEIMILPYYTELDIEQEMTKLYHNCEDMRLKVELLLHIHCLKETLTKMKKTETEKE